MQRLRQPGFERGHCCCLEFSRPWAKRCLLSLLQMDHVRPREEQAHRSSQCLEFCVTAAFSPVSGQLLLILNVPAQPACSQGSFLRVLQAAQISLWNTHQTTELTGCFSSLYSLCALFSLSLCLLSVCVYLSILNFLLVFRKHCTFEKETA